jgi:predicted phosphodiesterase
LCWSVGDFMRIAIVSDIHGNRLALEAVLKDLFLASPDLICHGGDLAANGPQPAEIIDQIRTLGWPGVCGNTDEMLWAPERLTELKTLHPKLSPILSAFQDMIATTCQWIGPERIGWLRTLPPVLSQGIMSLLHASPGDLWRAPLPTASNDELQSLYGPLKSRVAVYAHIHRPYVRSLAGFTVANSGSVSLSYDGDPRASYLLIDDEHIIIHRVEYDVELAAQELRRSGLPHADWLCSILRSGRYQPPWSGASEECPQRSLKRVQ